MSTVNVILYVCCILDCCKKQGVSEECQQALCTGQPMQANGQSVAHCFSDMDKVFKCIACKLILIIQRKS